MIVFLIFGIALLLPGIFFGALAVRSKNPRNLVSTTGELTRKKDYKNYKLQYRSVPNAVEYIYTYKVNGKLYHLSGVQHTHSRNLRKRVAIVYLRGFPRCAYQEHFSGIAEWLLALSLTATGILLLFIYFFVR